MSFDKISDEYLIDVIVIPDQKNVYKNKTEFAELGLYWVQKDSVYTNFFELPKESLQEIEWICKKNEFKY
jgi:hypothetical protein